MDIVRAYSEWRSVINNYSFANTGITELYLGSQLNTYGFDAAQNAFYQCRLLTKVTISNLNSISGNMFNECNGLKTFKIEKSKDASLITTLSGSLGSNLPSDLVILVPHNLLNSYKTATNWSSYANQIYPIGGQYSETLYIYTNNWTLNSQTNLYEATVTVVGATNESRNVIEYSLVDSSGNQIEDTYGLGASAQASRSITFTAKTVPTSTIRIFVKSTLTNYQE